MLEYPIKIYNLHNAGEPEYPIKISEEIITINTRELDMMIAWRNGSVVMTGVACESTNIKRRVPKVLYCV